jgi:hypothetical protein
MSSWDGGFSPAQSFHPEFGYLCPSAQFRRKARVVAVTLAAGMLIAGSMALALLPQLAPQPAGDGERAESLVSAIALPATSGQNIDKQNIDKQAIDKAADLKATGLADEGMPAATMARAAVTARATSWRAPAACDDLSGSFLAPQCQLGKTGKAHPMHPAHEAGNRVATVAIGRSEPPAELREAAPRETGSQELPRKVAASRPAPAAETAATAVATNETSTPMTPPSKPAVPVKKPAKTAQKQTPNQQTPNQQAPGRDAASAEPPATAPSHGFDLFALFHQPPRTGNGFWALQ